MGDLGQAVAGGPAHQHGRGVDPGPRAQLPHARVRFRVQFEGLVAHGFQRGELGFSAPVEQAMVEESLRRAQDDVAIDVVLEMFLRLVADAHGTIAPVAGQVVEHGFGQLLFQADAVQGLDVAAFRAGDDIRQPAQILFHRAHFGQTIECAHDKEGVTQPAVAVIPVAAAARRFRDARRHGGDDGARVFI
ncbi:hypothetical protein D3C72_1619750 [compost metagenome]